MGWGWNLPPGVTQRMIDEHMGAGPECQGCHIEDCELEEVWINGHRLAYCGDCAAERDHFEEMRAEDLRERSEDG